MSVEEKGFIIGFLVMGAIVVSMAYVIIDGAR
jgi:hypothetical protein